MPVTFFFFLLKGTKANKTGNQEGRCCLLLHSFSLPLMSFNARKQEGDLTSIWRRATLNVEGCARTLTQELHYFKHSLSLKCSTPPYVVIHRAVNATRRLTATWFCKWIKPVGPGEQLMLTCTNIDHRHVLFNFTGFRGKHGDTEGLRRTSSSLMKPNLLDFISIRASFLGRFEVADRSIGSLSHWRVCHFDPRSVPFKFISRICHKTALPL